MIALELLLATLFSSLVGSMHCVGMCTPFAILAMGPIGSKQSKSIARLSSYHLGRLVTYLSMGATIAMASSFANLLFGGGLPYPIVGWLVGWTMICMGIARLLSTYAWKSPVRHSVWTQRWTGIIVRLRRSYSGGPVWIGAFLWGLTSTLLPCGWLYIFVLAAAAAPSFAMTIAMMVAFWVGTLPFLSVVAWGWTSLPKSWQPLTQPFAAGCIISFGAFLLVQQNMLARSSAIVSRKNAPLDAGLVAVEVNVAADGHTSSALEMIRQVFNTQLPCCRGTDVVNPK